VTTAVRRIANFFFIGALATGLMNCAAVSKPGEDLPAALYTAKQQFAGGRYRESLAGCRVIIDGRPGCTFFDQALYYAALNSMKLNQDQAGRVAAARYFRQLIVACPASPYRPEAEMWLAALTDLSGHNNAMEADSLKKKDQEIKRLRAEVQRLNREIDLLKNVDVLMHRQKKDLDDGPDERKNSRP